MRFFRFLVNLKNSVSDKFPEGAIVIGLLAAIVFVIMAIITFIGYGLSFLYNPEQPGVAGYFTLGTGFVHTLFLALIFGYVFYTVGKDIWAWISSVWRNTD